MWQVVDAHDHTITVCRDEVAARAVLSIPFLATEIQRLRDENANLDSACKIADRQNEELREALKDFIAAFVNPGDEGPFEAGEVPALDKARALLNTESEQ